MRAMRLQRVTWGGAGKTHFRMGTLASLLPYLPYGMLCDGLSEAPLEGA